jgi:hypothetical protein
MKKITFKRISDVDVQFLTSLRDEENLDENFVINKVYLNTYLESNLFFFFSKRPWTLNEMIFFAENNNMEILIYSESDELLKTYNTAA